MSVITIREQQKTDTGFTATLSFDGRVNYPITITDPFTPQDEQQLEWYFEDWLVFPQLGTVKASQVAESVKSYGTTLFEQVFSNRDAYSEYRQLRGNLAGVQIEIESQTPEFQALHWEALRDSDPDWPRPLAIDCVMLRKRVRSVPVRANVQQSPVINLLVVTARPDEENDVGYRTISRPLLEAIETARLRVNVELLRPGTYKALSQHLEEKGAGYYHIIHFDAHGALMTYEQMQKGVEKKRYLFQARYGRGDIQRYEGVKAFLFLEGETKGKADPVEASELAALLTGKGIPVCVLNACQSGKQVRIALTPPLTRGEGGVNPDVSSTDTPPNPPLARGGEDDYSRETSLGSRLMAAGMQMVVAMGYSVTVTAASLLMETVYRQLFAEKEITEALRLGRKELFNCKGRKAYYNQTIDLEDWLLPVVYSNQQVNLNLREFTPQEKRDYFLLRSKHYRFTAPTYGFVGRDLEILKVEKALLRHNILLLQGMGGTGKTTLLNYLREWWQRTHFAQEVFYFGYDEKAWTLQQILREIGKKVYKDEYDLAIFQATPLPAQMAELVELLKANSYALILDNLESVTGQRLAIQNTLSKKKQAELREFLALLLGGKTRVVLGSRSGEEWLQGTTFKTNVYHLQGLDPQSRSQLAEKILERHVVAHRISKIREDAEFARLMKLLAGYPLAMEVVLANLRQQSPGEILQGLQAADVNLDNKRESGDKTESILKCVEYSHSNLSLDAQRLLLCLAPFSGFIDRSDIPNYVKQLQSLEPFKDYPFEKFDGAIQEAINWGLLSALSTASPPQPPLVRGEQEERLLTIQPVFPYFLKTKLGTLDEAMSEALREGFKNHYLGLADYYNLLMESKDAPEQKLGQDFCRMEYENFYNALQISLERQESIDIFFCLDKYLELINDIQRGLSLSEFVCQAQQAYPSERRTGKIGYEIVKAWHRLACCYLQTKNYQKARESYHKVVELTQQLSGVEERQRQSVLASTYHQLGKVALESRQFEVAQRYCQQALEIKIEFGERYSLASTYHQLGRVAEELREFEQAQRYYQQALEIWSEFSDRHNQAHTYHQLGMVAEELLEFEEARRYYQQSLDINIEFGDRFSQANTYHQLGLVAQELREFEEAQRYCQLALEIYIEYDERYEQAGTYHQLGGVAQELQEFEEARRYYQQALEIFIKYGDCFSQAITYHNLGVVAQKLREFEEARRYYQQALEIFIEYSDHFSQASTYHQLGRVAQELQEFEEAWRYYQQALEIKSEFSDRYKQADTYHALGLLAEAQENYAEAKANLQTALEIYLEYQDEYWVAVAREALERLPDDSGK